MKASFCRKVLFVLVSAVFFSLSSLKAQVCPPIVVSSINSTDASCPSSGTINILATGSGLVYRIANGPAGFLATSNTTGIFSGLLAGSYTIEIKDNCAVTTTVNRTINNTYPSFSINSSSVVNVCTSSLPGGTVNFSVTGGKPPYQYDVVPVGSLPVYSANTNSTNLSKAVNSFNTYRIFVKDACGEVRTRDIGVQASQPHPYYWWSELSFNRPCNEILDGLNTVSLLLHYSDLANSGINMNNLIGSSIKIYNPSVPNSITSTETNGSCSVALGSLISSTVVSAVNIDPARPFDYPVTIPKKDVIIVLTTLCGEEEKICYNYNEGAPDNANVEFGLIQNTCTGSWATQNLFIENLLVFGMTYPINYVLTKQNGGTDTNNDGYFYNLLPANFPVTIVATDACGRIVNRSISLPVQGSALQASFLPEWDFTCSNVRNSVSAYVKITGGDLQGIGEATNVTISGGPLTAIPKISKFQSWIPGYGIANIVAGYNYKIMITNQCGEKDSILFTSPADNWGQDPLLWNLQATITQLCGQNKANIEAKANYTGYENIDYKLYNTSSGNMLVSSNTNGLFNNIPSGNYKIKIEMDVSNAEECPDNFIRDSIFVTVISDAVGQSITKKTIMNCESGGVPSSTGKAIIEVNGAAPFTYEIIRSELISTASEIWNNSSTNNPSNTYAWNIPLAGDPSNTIYSLRSTDKCGNKITTMAALQPLSAPSSLNQVQPCLGQVNYTTGINAYTEGFTYRWVKLPDLVTTVASSNVLQFPGSYFASYDGTYKCYISYAGCIDREVNIVLNSVFCGAILPVKLISFNGQLINQNVQLNWSVETETDLRTYTIERSTSGNDFQPIRNITANQNSNRVSNYSITDDISQLNSTQFYYRLKMVHKDGTIKYSGIIKIATSRENKMLVYPNPVKDITTVSLNSINSGNGQLKIYDKTGRVVFQKTLVISKGTNNFPLTPDFVSGTYLVEISIEDRKFHTNLVKL